MKLKSLIKEIAREVTEDSGLGADFDRAQQSHDAQMPPDEDPEMECPKCGGSSGKITKNYRSGKYYSWDAKCDSCGHIWGNDNFDDQTTDNI